MMRLVLICLLAGFLSAPARAAETLRFEDYAAAVEKVEHPAAPRLSDAKSRQYKSQLRDVADREVNFAGHYVLASWGCGASCVMAAAVDAKTGSVAWLPFTVCCWPLEIEEPLEFKPDSRLLIVHGGRNEKASGIYFYAFDGTRFQLVKAEEKRGK